MCSRRRSCLSRARPYPVVCARCHQPHYSFEQSSLHPGGASGRVTGSGNRCHFGCAKVNAPATCGIKGVLGPPCPDRVHPVTGRVGLRGAAVGTAVFTKVPGRPPIDPFCPGVSATSRISEAFVRLGPLEIKVISLYGWPACLPDAAAKNNWLLGQALDRVHTSRVPALLGGDLNHCPFSSPIWQEFARLGYHELGQFADVLPPTCKGSTRFDTFLIPPSLLPFVRHADVLNARHIFDAHAPMRLHLEVPGVPALPRAWRLPKPFAHVGVEASSLAAAYGQVSDPVRPVLLDHASDISSRLKLWSATVESAADRAIRADHAVDSEKQPWTCLPAACRGRCLERSRVCLALPYLPRRGRCGDPRQRLKQARRSALCIAI